MTLSQRIIEELRTTPSGQAAEICAFDEKLWVEVELADSGRLGCLLDRLDVQPGGGCHLNIDPVRMTQKITYLEEELEIIEVEGQGGRTILRSAPPRKEDQITSFFEMVLDPAKGLSLLRYRYDPDMGERTPVSVPLARDTLERLVDDLINLAQESKL
jgi:hypothetical protein